MINESGGIDDTAPDQLVDRAKRLFKFLGHTQLLKSKPARSVDAYESVLWLVELPHHPAVATTHRGGDTEPGDVALSIDRVARPAPPSVEQLLAPWLDGADDDPNQPPALRSSIIVTTDADDDAPQPHRLTIEDHPDVEEAYQAWLMSWRAWADHELRDRPVRDLYGRLFKVYASATGNPEELEVVLGVGCLAWTPPGHERVKRHLLTAPVAARLDDSTGRLTVEPVGSAEAFAVELDMLDPSLTGASRLNEIKEIAGALDAHPLHRDAAGSLARRIVHVLDSNGEYLDVDEAPAASGRAVCAFAPAILLRRRSRQGIVDIYRTIVDQLTQAGTVPDGLLPLVDPDHVPVVTDERTDGALVTVDDDPFLPLPVNDVQLRIIRQVDTKTQTLVQGPPGTGKTHTAAALLSHLLAQGKRVLVTAHTDRALKEVRDKLPAAIRPLSVAVVGSSREDMSDLKVAVERIAANAAEHDVRQAEKSISDCYDAIDRLRRQRAAIQRRLVELRAVEVAEHERAGVRGTLAALAQRHLDQADHLDWLCQYTDVSADRPPPLDNAEILEWHRYLRDRSLAADEQESRQRLLDSCLTPDPSAFATMVAEERAAAMRAELLATRRDHSAYAAFARLARPDREQVRDRLQGFIGAADDLARRPERWIKDALADIHTGRHAIWHSRAEEITRLISHARPAVAHLGSLTDVVVDGTEIAPLARLATNLLHYLRTGGTVKTGPDGTPKVGAWTAKPVRLARPLFERVRVGGLPPATANLLTAFVAWVDACRSIDALDRAWPECTTIPAEDTLQERLQWHQTELDQLHRALRFGAVIVAETQWLNSLGLPTPNWADRDDLRGYLGVVDAAGAADDHATAAEPLRRIEQVAADVAQWADAAPASKAMLDAVQQRDHNAYGSAYQRLRQLETVRRRAARRDALGERLAAAAPVLRHSIEDDPDRPSWSHNLARFEQAWTWAADSSWLRERPYADPNALQSEITDIDARIRDHVEVLAATRAWSHAVSSQRLTGRARADLEQYAYLVRKLGRGTGKYAAQRRSEIRQAMDRCRPAVPVWIMPIYRIAEQFRVRPNMFDVVIVDEASQAGLEATFLQYLAPKIVVVGDDKQVSPTAVGVDQQQLRDLANQYLADDPYRATWQDPQRSLFDEAKMRFRGLLTLVEHRRCVPEIIGFSNRIAYEPDGVRLIPVRQYGSDRLDPIKPVLVRDGYVRGITNKVNPAEVDAIVDQIEKCVADPRYDGLTFGVISLLGKAQADAIEKKLLERLPPPEWAGRQLRCGDSADFQGSERDVMFLSMVAAPEPGRVFGALTRDLYVQRYNVAASRARDQMWLFHSVSPAELGNPDDMRFQLLDYCYGVVNRTASQDSMPDGTPMSQVPHDRVVPPFHSLFEQRVFNRLMDRGYTVVPQYPVQGYQIDLVVVGPRTRLAIECDGDAWHGPDAYERDLARQRDLERCGWRFHRIRESEFYVDEPTVLRDLWDVLGDLDIHPSGMLHQLDMPHLDVPPATHADQVHAVADPVERATDTDLRRPTPEVESAAEQQMPLTDGMAESQSAAAVVIRPTLDRYAEFNGPLPSPLEASRHELVDRLRDIVAVEGPILGRRLHSVFVRCAGGQRVGNLIAKTLNSAISAAVRQGILIEESPLSEAGVKPCTYRLPEQPAVHPRELGPRQFEDMPPSELAHLLAFAAREVGGWNDPEAVYRTALEQLGLKRLTINVFNRLQTIRASQLCVRDLAPSQTGLREADQAIVPP